MPTRTIVVLGGALGGPAAAARARETDEDARIVLIERSRDVSYAGCGLAYHLSGEVPSLETLNREGAAFFWDVYRVEVRTGVAVSGIDPSARSIGLAGERLSYTQLVYAAGAESHMPPVRRLEGASNVFRFRTLSDLETIALRLGAGAQRVTVLGGGFFGVEAADAFLRRGCEVTMVERGPQLLPQFTRGLAREAAAALGRAGAKVLTGIEVERAETGAGEVRALRLRGGRTLATDVVIVTAGVRPRTELLGEAGAMLLPDGSVPVDNRCGTSLPNVFACGVCVSVPNAVTNLPAWSAQAALADKTAQVAGAQAAGGDARLLPMLGTAIVRAAELTLGRTGLTHDEAAAYAGAELLTTSVHAPSCEPFFPGSAPVTIQLFHHRRSGRILGAEVAGRAGVDTRVDVLAAAILGGLTVEQLALLDLAYAPPYSVARDPVNVAGTVAVAVRTGLAAPLSPTELAARKRGLTLVDVRSEEERTVRGTLAGSLAIPLEALRRRLGSLRGRRVVFVCETGRLAYLATRIARQKGLPGAAYLSGGLRSWVAEGRPLANGAAR